MDIGRVVNIGKAHHLIGHRSKFDTGGEGKSVQPVLEQMPKWGLFQDILAVRSTSLGVLQRMQGCIIRLRFMTEGVAKSGAVNLW